jgi:hypothetical protein
MPAAGPGDLTAASGPAGWVSEPGALGVTTDESEVLSREEALAPGLPRFRWDSQEAVR